MFPTPRLVAIDDNPEHLRALVEGLNGVGAACFPVWFPTTTLPPEHLNYVRAIFTDLHLADGGASSDKKKNFSVIGGLIEEGINASNGPYLIVVWTNYPEEADGLLDFLVERLKKAPPPVAVVGLDKKAFIGGDNRVSDPKALKDAITSKLVELPQIAALLNWEARVLAAAGETVHSIVKLVPAEKRGAAYTDELGRILSRLAAEAVGKKNVGADRLRATSEALQGILYDRLGRISAGKEEASLWEKAVAIIKAEKDAPITALEAATLNGLLHVSVESNNTATDRGAVVALPADWTDPVKFSEVFGVAPDEAGRAAFAVAGYKKGNKDFRWVLVQIQAVCDYAQPRPGPVPYALGLEMPAEAKLIDGFIPAAFWPQRDFCFAVGGKARRLGINFRFCISMAKAAADKLTAYYRLREQLMNEIGYALHVYGARPGFISFKEQTDGGEAKA